MNTKRSMVVLFAVAVTSFSLPGAAFAAETLPSSAPAQEQMAFDPLLYITVLLGALTLSSVVVSIVFAAKFRTQKQYICHTYTCHNNPQARLDNEGVFDYRQFETPEELLGSSHAQSDFVVEEVIRHLVSEPAPQVDYAARSREHTAAVTSSGALEQRPAYVGKHCRKPEAPNPEPVFASGKPRITLLPDIHKTSATKKAAASDVPEELEFLLRKIS